MDLLTQGLLGATLSQVCANDKNIKQATKIGFLSGLLADADALISSGNDSLYTLEYHRHFSHSLIFIPVGAFIAFVLLWPFFKNRLSAFNIYKYAFLGYATSGLLDACTSYGTHLLWPFTSERVAWNLISIVDPVFSLILLGAIVLGYKKRHAKFTQRGLVLVIFYLIFSFFQQSRVIKSASQNAATRGHEIQRLVAKPTLGNVILWRVIYESDAVFYVDAIRVGIFGNSILYQGDAIPKLNLERDFPDLPGDSVMASDVSRFQLLSDQYVAKDPRSKDLIGDIRYAMLPHKIEPLWGIEILSSPSEHAQFKTFRKFDKSDRDVFIKMLLGQKL